MIAVWSPPEQKLRNGIIQLYKICVRRSKTTDQCQERNLLGSQQNFVASHLAPFTEYDIIVSAATSMGFGPSIMVTNKTMEAGQYR